MVSGQGAAAREKTHGSMRRDSITFILRRLGLSHYTKTEVDAKVAAGVASYNSGVLPDEVSLTYATKSEVSDQYATKFNEAIERSRLETRIQALEDAAKTYADRDYLFNKYATIASLTSLHSWVQVNFVGNERLAEYATLQSMDDKVQPLATTFFVNTFLTGVKDELAESITHLNTDLTTDISELQTAIQTVGDSVLDHRSTFDTMVLRQAGEDGAWDGSATVNGMYVYASYLRDNDISEPNFNWPWITPPSPDTRQYWSTNSGNQYIPSLIGIETFTDEEQNYVTGNFIQIKGVIGSIGGIDADQINGTRRVSMAVSEAISTKGYAYLVVQLDAGIETGTGAMTGVSWVSMLPFP